MEQGTRGRLHTSEWGYQFTFHKYFLIRRGPSFTFISLFPTFIMVLVTFIKSLFHIVYSYWSDKKDDKNKNPKNMLSYLEIVSEK